MILMGELQYDGRVRKEALSLVRNGYKVTVVTMPRAREHLEGLEPVRVNETLLVSRRLARQTRGLALKYGEFVVRATAKAIAQPASVYHAHDLPALLPAYVAAKIKGARLVYDAHELWTEQGTAYSDRNHWRRLERWLIKQVDAIITVNQSRAQIIREEYGAPVLPVVVQNCPPFQNPLDDKTTQLKNFVEQEGITEARRFVLYQGSIQPGRNLSQLVSSGEYLAPGTVIVLLGFGNSEFLASLRRQVADLQLEKKVLFHPPVPNTAILDYTRSADAGIVFYEDTSRNNRFCAPNKLYEYMMTSVPVVASDLPGIREVMDTWEVGLMVNSSDPKAIAKALNQAAQDTDMRKRWNTRSLEAAQQSFNWEVQERALLSAYTNL